MKSVNRADRSPRRVTQYMKTGAISGILKSILHTQQSKYNSYRLSYPLAEISYLTDAEVVWFGTRLTATEHFWLMQSLMEQYGLDICELMPI